MNWIKDKWQRFKKWIVGALVTTGIVAVAFGAPADTTGHVTAPENNTFTIGIKNYESTFAPNITDDRPLQYKDKAGFISFKPVEIRLDTGQRLKLPQSSEKKSTPRYDSVFGEGINLQVNEGQRTWQKVISVDSLGNLATVLPDTGYVEVVFEIETDLVIDGWNKKDDFYVTGKIRLGDFSYLEVPQAWDSFSETTCDDGIDELQICETLTNRIDLVSYFSSQGQKLFFTKQIPLSWIKSAQFPIFTDADVTYGTRLEFSGNNNVD